MVKKIEVEIIDQAENGQENRGEKI